jgi:hypothetical protein
MRQSQLARTYTIIPQACFLTLILGCQALIFVRISFLSSLVSLLMLDLVCTTVPRYYFRNISLHIFAYKKLYLYFEILKFLKSHQKTDY